MIDTKFQKSQKLRLLNALNNSIEGMIALWRNEKAFRFEIYLSVPLLVILYFLKISLTVKLILIVLLGLLLLTEAINSAIEALVDRISLEIHPQSKLIKDIGSAAVGITIMMNIIGWIFACLMLFSS